MKATPEQKRHLEERARSGIRPRYRGSVSEWAERNIYLPAPQTQSPGWLTFNGREYIREPLDCFSDPTVTDAVLCFGSQTGKTTLGMAGAAFIVAEDPGAILWVFPGGDLAASFSTTRWMPLVEASPGLAARIPQGRFRHRYKTMEQKLGASLVTFTGSNSPAALASRPVRTVILDEIDKFPVSTKGEADAVNLAEQRTKSFANPRRIKMSTPALSDGLTWQEFQKGDQRRYVLSCPGCGKPIVLGWSKSYTVFALKGNEAWARWDHEAKHEDGTWDLDRVFSSARYECPHCGHDIDEAEKTKAIKSGRFEPTATARAGWRSYHLPSLYATSLQTSCGALAVRFLQQKSSLLGLQGFINGDLAEPWENQESRAERVEIIAQRDAPALAEATPILSVDYQAAAPYSWLVCRAWTPAGNSRLLFAGSCDEWETIRAVQLAFKVADKHVTIDSGHRAADVYEHCLRWGTVTTQGATRLHIGWTPAKGRDASTQWTQRETGAAMPYHVGLAALNPGQPSLPLLHHNGEFLMDVLTRLRKGPEAAGGKHWELVQFPTLLPEVPAAVPVTQDEYFRHLDAKIHKPLATGRTGKIVWRWVLRSTRWPDHLLDCEIMQLAMALLHRLLPSATKPPPKA